MSAISYIKAVLNEISPRTNIASLSKNIKGDIVAGITVGIIALPLALAFGEISQLGPIAGVWGAIAGGIVGGFFGGCLVGVSGPTAPKAAQIAAYMSFFVIGSTNDPDLVAAFSIIFLSGIILVIISFARISHFIHYTPYPVVAGFMCGIGVIVILTQLNAFVGLEVKKSIHDVIINLSNTINNANIEALYVSLPSLAILFLWPFLGKKYSILNKIPAPLTALLVGTCVAQIFNLDIPYIGDKMDNTDANQIFSIYIPDLSRTISFLSPAFALAALAVLDSLLSCKVADNITGKRHSSDRETFGQGMANIAAGLLGGVTTATATMRTVANIKFGGKTPLASIVHGLTLMAVLLGLGFLVAKIPTACLAAILFKVGIEILDYRIIPVINKLPTKDLIIFCMVLFITVYEDLMVAITIGVIFAVLSSIKDLKNIFKEKNVFAFVDFSDSDYAEGLDTNEMNHSNIKILKLKGSLFFGSVEKLIKSFNRIPNDNPVIIDMKKVPNVDLSGIFGLEDLIKLSQSQNRNVAITNANEEIRNNLIALKFIENIGSENIGETPVEFFQKMNNDSRG
ncbi:MAG: SulP family inorganic anion transporter [bacterium]